VRLKSGSGGNIRLSTGLFVWSGQSVVNCDTLGALKTLETLKTLNALETLKTLENVSRITKCCNTMQHKCNIDATLVQHRDGRNGLSLLIKSGGYE